MIDDSNKSFWEHAHDLRSMLLKSLACIFAGFILSLLFYTQIFQILEYPLHEREQNSLHKDSINYERFTNYETSDKLFSIPANSKLHAKSEYVKQVTETTFLIPQGNTLTIETYTTPKKLFILGPIDGISTTFKVCLILGIFLTAPIWTFFILSFIAPALDQKFYRLITPFLLLSIFFMLLGASFAFFLTIPIANQYLQLFNQDLGVNLWSLSNYLDYTLILIAGNAICFEMAVIALFLVHFGVLNEIQLKKGRRYFTLGAFIISAILTPPDVLTQIMLAIPLIILYECTILYARLLQYHTTAPSYP